MLINFLSKSRLTNFSMCKSRIKEAGKTLLKSLVNLNAHLLLVKILMAKSKFKFDLYSFKKSLENQEKLLNCLKNYKIL